MSKRYLDYHGVTVLWTALKNYIASVTPSIKKLTFTGGVTAEYDGTEDVTVNIPTGGSGGTTNYSNLSNKPKINNVELSGNKTTTQLGIDIPTKVSDLTNDSGFITTETDPTVPAWAKNSTKPTYTASEVGALPANYTPPVTSVNNQTGAVSLNIPTTQDIQAAITVNPYTIADSTPIATINGVEISAPTAGSSTITTVQSDWNVTDTTSGAYIANKPTIPTATSDLTNDSGFLTAHQDISGKANIADLATVATSGSYNDLSNKPNLLNYLDTRYGGTIQGELVINNSELLKEDADSALTILYDGHNSGALRVQDISYGDFFYFNFPNKTGTIALTESPVFIGNPRAVTVDASDNSTTIATTAFVKRAIDNAVFDSSLTPEELDETLSGVIDSYLPKSLFKIIYQNGVYKLPSSLGGFDGLVNNFLYKHFIAVRYNNKCYNLSQIVAPDDTVVNAFVFTSTELSNNVITCDKFTITKDTSADSGCTITRSTETLTFAFNSNTSTLDISSSQS